MAEIDFKSVLMKHGKTKQAHDGGRNFWWECACGVRLQSNSRHALASHQQDKLIDHLNEVGRVTYGVGADVGGFDADKEFLSLYDAMDSAMGDPISIKFETPYRFFGRAS